MTRRFVFVGAAMAAALSLNLAALASANDYVFEPVKAEIKKGNDVIVSVRLKHKATGKPADAVIVQTRIDMAPDGMAEMASGLTPIPSDEPGVYSFKTELPIRGAGCSASPQRSKESQKR
jgi:YtkA-like